MTWMPGCRFAALAGRTLRAWGLWVLAKAQPGWHPSDTIPTLPFCPPLTRNLLTEPSTAENLPVLYSFRRCPYAIRARMAIACAGLTVELREVLLRIKPETMLAISPKGTVPVLQLAGGQVIDESIEIMRWALSFSDPDGWLEASAGCEDDSAELVVWNDGGFKHYLDRYKYADRFPENARDFYRGMAEPFLLELECRLSSNPYLFGSRLSLTDVAVFPFVRQFAGVDRAWFGGSRYRAVRAWLQGLIDSPLFGRVMHKYPSWNSASFRTLMGMKQGPETPRAS